jgi:uncharacterized protein YcfJ
LNNLLIKTGGKLMQSWVKNMSVGLLLPALLSGCATTGTHSQRATQPGAPQSKCDEVIQNEEEDANARMQGAALAALGGALIGGGIGAAVGGKKGALAGGGIGAALGGFIGYQYTSSVVDRKNLYESEAARLDCEINIAAKHNHKLREYNDDVKKRITEIQNEINATQTKGKQKQNQAKLTQNDQKKIEKILTENQKAKEGLEKELKALTEYHESLKQQEDKTSVTQLEQEITALKMNITMLDSNNQQISQIISSSQGRTRS